MTVNEYVALLVRRAFRPDGWGEPFPVPPAGLTEGEADRLVNLASDLLRAALGTHGYCYAELHDMFPHGSDPETTDPANGTTHGKGNSEFPYVWQQWEDYYDSDTYNPENDGVNEDP